MGSVYIIAEAGVNHNGDINVAKRLIDVAVEAGVDAIKFQTFKATNLASKLAKKADYQNTEKNNSETQLEMLKRLELDIEMHKELLSYCQKVGITFLSTPFDLESIDLLVKLGIDTIKIPSGEITNYPYLKKVGTLKKNVILSTGMSNLEEIREALQILYQNGTTSIKILHCTTEYPAPMDEINLRAMKTIQDEFHIEVGYSDHTCGIEIPIAAVAMGATIIEKHFTLDKNMEGPDHRASLEPNELKSMVKAIRNVEKAMGDGIKRAMPSEEKNKDIVRKSIVAKRTILEKEVFTEDNLTIKRPGNGISPMRWNEVLGKKAITHFEEDDLIKI